MGAYSDILAGMLGSVVRAILNKLGADIQTTTRHASTLAEIENEINYFTTGSVVQVSDTGAIYSYDGANWNLVWGRPDVNYADFNTSAGTPTHQEGRFYWDATEHTLSMMTEFTGTSLQVGQEFFVRALNKTGAQIDDGSVVHLSGAQGNRPTIELAIATDESADKIIGVATSDIANNGEGYVTVVGTVRGYNTSSFNDGDQLYISETVSGGLQNTKPTAPNHAVRVARALNSTTNGSIYVDVHAGTDLLTLHDVNISTPSCGDSIRYTAIDGVWVNRQIFPIVTKTDDYEVDRADIGDGTILVQCSSADITITLPDLTDVKTHYMRQTIKKIDATAHNVIIDGNGYNIDGSATKSITTQYGTLTVHNDGTSWWVV